MSDRPLDILWTPRALADLEGVREPVADRLTRAVVRFAQDRHGDVKKLADPPDTWRLRVGDWRVLFTYYQGGLRVVRVLARRDAYR